MEYEVLKRAAQKIMMPEEMKHRITENCKKEILNTMEEPTMKKCRNNVPFRKSAAVFAALATCLSLSVTALATGKLQGFFRDITDWRGAIVGTAYEQATDEIGMHLSVHEDSLTVLAIFSDPQKFPYREAEKLSIAAYQIVDGNGSVVREGTATDSASVANGQAAIQIPLDGIGRGCYKLLVTAFVTEKKADQPLVISGDWECSFVK